MSSAKPPTVCSKRPDEPFRCWSGASRSSYGITALIAAGFDGEADQSGLATRLGRAAFPRQPGGRGAASRPASDFAGYVAFGPEFLSFCRSRESWQKVQTLQFAEALSASVPA